MFSRLCRRRFTARFTAALRPHQLPALTRRTLTSAADAGDAGLAAALAAGVEQRLPLLDAFVQTLQHTPHVFHDIPDPVERASVSSGAAKYRPLSGVDCVMIQHQLGQHVAFVRALFALGLSPARTYSIDIPYTANTSVVDRLVHGYGVPETNVYRHAYRAGDPYHPYQFQRVAGVMKRLLLDAPVRPRRPLLVIDDGAYWLDAMSHHTPGFDASALDRLCVVEQTQRGFIKLRTEPAMLAFVASPPFARARVPIVNVAECRVKKQIEPQQIGDNAVRNVTRALKQYRPAAASGRDAAPLRILLIGYGAIGRGVTLSVRNSFKPTPQFTILDFDKSRQQLAVADGCALYDASNGGSTAPFDVVIGCSGVRSFGPADAWRHGAGAGEDGVLLISVSSGSHELAFDEYRDAAVAASKSAAAAAAASGVRIKFASATDRAAVCEQPFRHQNVSFVVTKDARPVRVTVLNCGFPITFNGDLNAVPGRLIQATIACMTAGAVDAVTRLKARDAGAATHAAGSNIALIDPRKDEWIETNFPKFQF